MQGIKLRESVQIFIPSFTINMRHCRPSIVSNRFFTKGKMPHQCTTFSCCQVLYRMETERTEVSYLASHFSMPLSTKSMGIIGSHYDTADSLLDLVRRTKQMLLRFYSSEHFVKVTNHATKIHRTYHLCMFRDSLCQLVIIHFYRVLLRINHHHLTPHMLCHGCCSRISICRYDHLVIRLYSYQA